jgi:zinc protease
VRAIATVRIAVALMLASAGASALHAQSGVTVTSVDTSTSLFDVNGVQVIHRRLPTSNIVVAQIYLLGGSRQLTHDDAGIERAMLQASAYGTAKYPGGAAALALARTGSTIGVHVSRDWSLVELRTVRSELDSAWSVFADRIVAPELSTSAVSAVRDRMYIEQQMAVSDPDALIMRFADSVAFAGHPYAIDPNGNERSIRVMRSTEIAEYHKGEVATSRMLVVFVGHVTRPEIERLVSTTLATLPRGSYTWVIPPPLPSQTSRVIIIPRALKTNYLLGVFPGPPVGSRDNAAFRVATALLGARIAYTVREEKQLSYAAYAPFFDRAVASGGIYVSTAQPAKVLLEVVPIMSEVLSEGMEWRYLPRFLSQFGLEYLLKQETYDGQADELARAHLLRGNLQTDAWFVELKKVSPISMKLMSRKYFPHIQWIYVGDRNAIRSVLKD